MRYAVCVCLFAHANSTSIVQFRIKKSTNEWHTILFGICKVRGLMRELREEKKNKNMNDGALELEFMFVGT